MPSLQKYGGIRMNAINIKWDTDGDLGFKDDDMENIGGFVMKVI